MIVRLPSLLVLALSLALPVLPRAAEAGQDAPKVRITGLVRDSANAIPLPGIPVEIPSLDEVTYTDVDGRYVLQVPPGTYEIRVAMDGYQHRVVNVDAQAKRVIDLDVALTMNALTETVTVTGRAQDADSSTAEAQLTERRNASAITDNLGAREMRANADTTAAAAMQRVTGLSVVDNQYVYVRGLGERYSNTTLAGATIPTTEPDKKVVPLDMFPSGLLDSVQITKSYVPDRSAEFAGGLVQVVPLKFPSRPTLDFSYGIGWNARTAGEAGLGYPGGGRDWLGFDDGTRALPAGFPGRKVIRGGIFTPDVGFLRPELERLGESFRNVWELRPADGGPNQNFSGVFGNRYGPVGIVASYTQSYREQIGDERQIYYRAAGDQLTGFSHYDYAYHEKKANIGAVANLSYQFAPSQRLSWDNFYTHNGRDEARTFSGFNSDINTDLRNERLWFVEEGLISSSINGEHFFQGAANSRFGWRATYARADRDEPGLRETLYERNGNAFVLADESQSGFLMYNDLLDETVDVAANWSLLSAVRGLPLQWKLGGQYVNRTRDFSSRRFRFVPINAVGLSLALSPEQLFTPANIGPRFELKEETRTTDFYGAEQTVAGGYGMLDWTLSGRVRLIAGARVEDFDQQVNTFDLFSLAIEPEIISSRNQKTDVFPAANLVVAIRPDQNLRFGVSQTTNRPEFRELAPFEFTDIVGGRAVVGNPNLRRALIRNADARWEWFPGAEEVVSASVFYKSFDEPIERIVEPTAQLRTSFTNAESARNFGIELEARKRLAAAFLVGLNYTYVSSEVSLSPAAAQVQTSLSRPLEGQSENLFNLLFEARRGDTYGRVLYNFFGDRISDVGSLGLPDIVEEARGSLDVVLGTRWHRLALRVSLDNVLDDAYEFTQGGLLQREFTLGRTATVSVGFSAF